MSGHYQEFAPHPRLSSYVACYWTTDVRQGNGGKPHVVFPDGCIDFLFDTKSAELDVVGTMTSALWVPDCGLAQFVGVRFKPGGAVPFLGDRADLFTDGRVSLSTVFGQTSDVLRDSLADEATVGGRLQLLEQDLLSRLATAPEVDARIAWATEKLRTDPTLRIAELASDLDISRQYLRRLFVQHTGLSAKRFARVTRMNGLIPKLNAGSLCQVALDAGYVDQSHMNNEFRELVGVSPGEYRAFS